MPAGSTIVSGSFQAKEVIQGTKNKTPLIKDARVPKKKKKREIENLLRKKMRARRILLRFMLSSVTNEPFPPGAQAILSDAYDSRGFTSPYWCTLAQARRSLNVDVRPGEKPIKIFLAVEEVVPFRTLPANVARMILDEHPPYFASGVGILSEKFKWNSVLAARLVHRLNPESEERVLFIEKKFAAALGAEFLPSEVSDIRNESTVFVFNGDQLMDPFRALPVRGVAMDANTGKRVHQPAHDMLLAVGLMRGYTSPYWISEKNLSSLHVSLTPSGKSRGVAVSTLQGDVVSLLHLQKELPALGKKLKAKFMSLPHHHRLADGSQVYLYGVTGWEQSKSRVIGKALLQLLEPSEVSLTDPNLFVNLRDLQVNPPLLGNEDTTTTSAFSDDELKKLKTITPVVSLDEVTRKVYYNAQETTHPHYIAPPNRPIAVVNGRLAGSSSEATLRRAALTRKFSSPLWLTERGAKLCGVDILPSERRRGTALSPKFRRGSVNDQFVNVDDIEGGERAVLRVFPLSESSSSSLLRGSRRRFKKKGASSTAPPTRQVHRMLVSGGWRVVLGTHKQKFLRSLNRTRPLWISMTEIIMSGLQVKPQVSPASFGISRRSGKSSLSSQDAEGDVDGEDSAGGSAEGSNSSTTGELKGSKVVYNSQQTTDPVRVVGVSHYFHRPQGAKA